jgi:hypothetical protein
MGMQWWSAQGLHEEGKREEEEAVAATEEQLAGKQ